MPGKGVETQGANPFGYFQIDHRAEDPGETTNLTAKSPERVATLFALLKHDVERGWNLANNAKR